VEGYRGPFIYRAFHVVLVIPVIWRFKKTFGPINIWAAPF
jgi:hypothetical protein